MASKGQKFNKYTDEFKEKILKEYLNGEGSAEFLAQKYGISQGTLKTWKRKIDHPELQTGAKRGRQKEEDIDYKERYEILKKYLAFLKAQREKK